MSQTKPELHQGQWLSCFLSQSQMFLGDSGSLWISLASNCCPLLFSCSQHENTLLSTVPVAMCAFCIIHKFPQQDSFDTVVKPLLSFFFLEGILGYPRVAGPRRYLLFSLNLNTYFTLFSFYSSRQATMSDKYWFTFCFVGSLQKNVGQYKSIKY